MQTILGAGGAIGVELAKALPAYTDHIRLVSRTPQRINAPDELMAADVLNPADLKKAVQGSEIVYVTVGFPYRYKTWVTSWPPFIQNVVEICEAEGCKLVFFDNVYMYDRNHLAPMTEETPILPSSKKGMIRESIARHIQERSASGKLTALIARAADFYGPSIQQTSILTETVFKPLSKGQKATWMGSDQVLHSFTYTPDAGRATALLGNTPGAFGQTWHLPTAADPMKGKEWIELIAKKMGKKPSYRVVPRGLLQLAGLFSPLMHEMVEMLYQFDRDYVFSSKKFEQAFNFIPTSYESGIQQIIDSDFS